MSSSTISFTSTTTTKDSLDNKIIYHDKPHSVSLRSSKDFRNHEHEDEETMMILQIYLSALIQD